MHLYDLISLPCTTMTYYITWSLQVNLHSLRRFSYFVRNGLQRGPQTIVGADYASRYACRRDNTRYENAMIKQRRAVVPAGPNHFQTANFILFLWRVDGPIIFLNSQQKIVCGQKMKGNDVTGGGCQAMRAAHEMNQ